MSSKRNQTIAIARFLMYKHGLNQQLEGMTDEEYLAHLFCDAWVRITSPS